MSDDYGDMHMGYVLGGILGVVVLGTTVLLRHWVRLRLGGAKRDRLQTPEQAQAEAEVLTRNMPR
jgi:hypothetical protein